MATKMVRQTRFDAGQVDPINYRRTDLALYLRAAKALQNMEIGSTGILKKRRGTQYLLGVTDKSDDLSQIFPFQDKNNNYYIIEATNNKFHIYTQTEPVTFVQSVDTDFVSSDLLGLDYSLDNDSIVFAHANFRPSRLYIDSYSPLNFKWDYLDIFPPPAFDFNKVNYSNFNVTLSVLGNTLTFTFSGLSADPGYNNDWINGVIIGGGSSVEQPLGYAIITGVSAYAAGSVTFTGIINIPFETTNYAPRGSGYSIKQPVFTAALGYPSQVCFFQNRLWFGNTASLPTTVFGSVVNAPINFNVGVGAPSDALVYEVGQSDAGTIVALNGGKQLEIYCDNYEFVVPQDQSVAITPQTFSIRTQASFGSAGICKPIGYLNDSYYIAKSGKSIINFHFNGVGLAYVAKNVSLASQDLVKNPINRAIQRATAGSQDNYIYWLNSDKTITSFQFANEWGDPEMPLAALTPIVLEQNVEILDIADVNNEIYFLKKYTDTNEYVIEKFNDDYRMDGCINTTMDASGLVTGLFALNGYTVGAFFDGQDFGEYVVNGGEIVVDNPDGLSGPITIGLIYDVVITPLDYFAGENATDMFKLITNIYVDYANALNFYINGKLVPYQNFQEIQAGLPLLPKSGVAITSANGGYERNDQLTITQHAPFDLQILGVSYQITATLI